MQEPQMSTESNQRDARIRSFVRREGRFTAAQKQALQDHGSEFCLTAELPGSDIRHAFPRFAPLYLEIGCGVGETLLALATRHPGNNYCATEVYRPGVGNLLRQAAQGGLDNLRVIIRDVVECLENTIVDHSLAGVYIFFPDPWPKKRHHKRRLIQAEFVRRLQPKLRQEACVFLATDAADYALQMLQVMEANGYTNLAGPGRFAPRPGWRPLTRFEARGLRLGHTIFDLAFSPPGSVHQHAPEFADHK